MASPCRSIATAVALAGTFGALAALTGCAPGYNMVRANPGLYPTFEFGVTDYVNRCNPDDPTDVTVTAPDGTTVSIAGQPARRGTFTTQVDQQVNERFTIVVSSAESTTTHHVRCLPAGFPTWKSLRSGTPQAAFYATTMVQDPAPNWPVVFDTNGVPIWWTEPSPSILFTPLSNDNFAIVNFGTGMIERRLDGSVVRLLNTQGAPNDHHDAIRLPNGNYVMATLEPRPCDLSPWGRGQESCLFHNLQELTPSGQVVWNWRPEDDIPLSETRPRWRTVRDQFGRADPWHWNSVEWTGDGFIVSFRHLDAVYKIDYASKNVVWKLGGTARPESLRVIGDPVFAGGGSFSGQHDARLLAGGVVTLFDNRSRTGQAPRSVAYRIDENARTATLVRQVTDSVAPGSGCCGSTRVLAGGNYVTGWGSTKFITENAPDGTQVFRLEFRFRYRAVPLEPGRYTRAEFRAGMDAQYDNGALTPAATAPPPTAR